MQSKKIFSLIFILGLLLILGGAQIVQAEPAPSKLVANHETKECAIIFGGDECMDCLPPVGWDVLGWADQTACPEGYTFTQVEETCTPLATELCCTTGNSAIGDCTNMAINNVTLKCAFVEDIDACNLPLGWQAKPDDTDPFDWTCPGLYDWTKDLECQDEPISDEGDPDAGSGWLPFRCGGSALGGLLISAVFVFTIKRRKFGI